MGLKSLPILNKSGISIYWNNVWDSIKLYKKYSLSLLYVNSLVSFFINENAYYYCIDKIKLKKDNQIKINLFSRINTGKLKSLWGMRDFYLGKVLIFNNQGWFIILINYYVSRRCKILLKYDDTGSFKLLFKVLKSNKLEKNLKKRNFKFKF